MMSMRAWVPILVLAGLAVPFSGCGFGSAAVAAAVGGGGGGGAAEVGPTLNVEQAAFQPEDGSTLVGVTISQPSARTARLSFEFDLGAGRVRIPVSSLQPYDPSTRSAIGGLPLDAQSRFLAPTSRLGTTYYFLWKHAVDLGQVEQRGVTLWALLADAARAEPDDSASQVFINRTLGRQAPEIENFELVRASGDPEAPLTARITLLDRGADRSIWQYQLRYALTSAVPSASDFVALGGNGIAPTLDSELVNADGRVRSQLSFPVDVLSAGLPLGSHPGLWLSLGVTEAYPLFRSDIPQSTKSVSGLASLAVTSPAQVQIGYAPLVDNASVVNPGSPDNNGGDYGRPWLRLPIAVRVSNPSLRVTLRVRLSGDYAVGVGGDSLAYPGFDDGQWRPITPLTNGSTESEVEFDLPPNVTSQRFLVWNVLRDEGMGNRVPEPPPAPAEPGLAKREASIRLKAQAVGAKLGDAPLPVAGGSLEDNYPQPQAGDPILFTTLSTAPFVSFRENLLSNVQRTWSSGRNIDGQTRDIFFSAEATSPSGLVNSRLIGLNQQFEPVQITPPPGPFDFGAGSNIFEAIATDYDSANPDCLVWVQDRFRYVTWPSSGGAPVSFDVGSSGGSLSLGVKTGPQTASFTLPSPSGDYHVGLFYAWAEAPGVGADKTIEVQLRATVRRPLAPGVAPVAADFAPAISATLTRLIPNQPWNGSSPTGSPHMVVGEFDGDPATREVVVGNLGVEFATAGRPGLLEMWTLRINSSGALEYTSVQSLPKPQTPLAGPNHPIERWSLHLWRQDGASRDALALVRCMARQDAPLPVFFRSVDFKLLNQLPNGGFESSWTTVSEELRSNNGFPELANVSLRRVFTQDIDGSAGGIEGSDLLLTFERTVNGGPTPGRHMDAYLLARRASRSARWRRLYRDIPMQSPAGLLSAGRVLLEEAELVDVNGDRLLDLVTREDVADGSQKHYNYFASTLAGVAGKMGSLANSAGQARSQLPGIFDFNKDGRSDVLSGGRVHKALANGQFENILPGLAGGVSSEYRVERVFLDAPADSIEVVVSDATDSVNNRIDRIAGIGGLLSSIPLFAYDLGGTEREVRALMAPDSMSRMRKDLVGLVGSGFVASVRRGRIEGSSVEHSALWSGNAAAAAGMALVRREPMVPGMDPALDSAVQDVVVVDAANQNRIVVLDAMTGYTARFFDLPGGQVALRLAEGSVSEDRLEDLLVLTELAGVYRVLCVTQSAVLSEGVAQPAQVKTLLQFSSPFGAVAAVPRSFQFSRRIDSLADGFLLLEHPSQALSSEARFIKPVGQGGSFGARLVRSPLRDTIGAELRVVVDDRDQDGVLDVIGGEQATTSGLRRLQTNVRN